MQLRATYARVEDFLRDHEEQIARGGLLVRCGDPPALERGATVELEVVTPVGTARLDCQVIQVLAGAGVAVTVVAADLASLAEAARSASREISGGDGVPAHAPGSHWTGAHAPGSHWTGAHAPGSHSTGAHAPDSHSTGAHAPDSHSTGAHAPASGAALARKIQQALHGDKNQRTALLREPNKMIHGYVVRNAQIQVDEVIAIARMTTVSVDVLTYIASRREWAERPEVAIALVRNPRTPVPLAIRLLDRVLPADLRQLAKQSTVREAIQRAARKKVIG